MIITAPIAAPTAALAPHSPLTIRRAIEAVKDAQFAAIQGADETAELTEDQLSDGVSAARQAVRLLVTARPSTPFQHLDVAARHMQTAADALTSATYVMHAAGADFHVSDKATADVQRLSMIAYNAIDSAFENIFND
jgi:hypothetical protein